MVLLAVVSLALIPATVSAEPPDAKREQYRSAQCRGAQKGLSWYVRWTGNWRERMGRARPALYERASECPRYLAKLWRARAREARRAYEKWWRWMASDPTAAILHVFGPVYGPQALRVASCESGRGIWATNGQYLGMFQMGSFARAKYGHGSTPYRQALAAFAYFVSSGRDWSPWSCKPW